MSGGGNRSPQGRGDSASLGQHPSTVHQRSLDVDDIVTTLLRAPRGEPARLAPQIRAKCHLKDALAKADR
jgi:hypothetical protein